MRTAAIYFVAFVMTVLLFAVGVAVADAVINAALFGFLMRHGS